MYSVYTLYTICLYIHYDLQVLTRGTYLLNIIHLFDKYIKRIFLSCIMKVMKTYIVDVYRRNIYLFLKLSLVIYSMKLDSP